MIFKEIHKFFCKSIDFLFLTNLFFNFQIKYSKAFKFNYYFNKKKTTVVHPPKTCGTYITTLLTRSKKINFPGAHALVSKKCSPNKFNYIFLIRDPIDRLYSFYLMSKKNKKIAFYQQAKKSFDHFVKVKFNQNTLCRFLVGELYKDIDQELFIKSKYNLCKMYAIINFNDSNHLKKILNKFDIKSSIKLIKKKRVISKEKIRLIKKFNYYDIQLYNFYKKLKK